MRLCRSYPTSLTIETIACSSTSKRGRACNSEQGAAAAMALTATAATWNVQLTESKECCWVPESTLSATMTFFVFNYRV
jgi:hypothetical protein